MRPEIKTPLPGPKAKEVLERDSKYVSPAYTRSYPFVMARGQGSWVWDIDDNKFLDMTAGIAVTTTGHAHPEIVKAISEQASKFLHMAGADFYYENQTLLAEKLAEIAPGAKNRRVFFANSGTEANEAALKLARYYTKRPIYLAFYKAFHGRSFGSLSLTASKAVQRKYYAPMVPQVVHIPFPDPYRPPFGIPTEKLTDTILDFIENTVFHTVAPPEDVAAFIVEPIQGEGGYVVPPSDFYPRLHELLKKYDILLIDDEVQAGMGRTGKMFAMEHFGVIPDVITVAKGIASGLPLGAAISKTSLMNWEPGSHSSTFGGNPVAIAAALKTIELLENGLVENAAKMGELLKNGLKEIQKKFEFIGDVRGLGLMLGVDIVKDRETREPDGKLRDKIVYKCFENGLLVLGAGESVVRWSPSLVITEDEVSVALEIFENVLKSI